MSQALFLDRDGVLNELVYYASTGELESPRTVHDLQLIPSSLAALRSAMDAGWTLFIVSNQPSYAKGKTTLAALQEVQAEVIRAAALSGVTFRETYLCFHHPDGIVEGYSGPCACRKPSPTSLRLAAEHHGVDLRSSWMIGDQDNDIECGQRAGCQTALMEYDRSLPKRGRLVPDARYPDLAAFVRDLCEKEKRHVP